MAATTARLPGLEQWGRVVDWRRHWLERLPNVEVFTGVRLDAAATRAYGAELAVIATGARWLGTGESHLRHSPIPGAALPHVLTPEDVLLRRPSAGRLLVYDCEGYLMGVGMAEMLAMAGSQVMLLTPHAVVGPYLDRTFEGAPVRRRLHDLGVEMRTDATLEEIGPDSCTLMHYGVPSEVAADGVVLVTARRSNDDLLRQLRADKAGLEAVFAIGDCVAPRQVADCIFDGHRLAREIDQPDPSTPLPYLRERAILHM